MDARAVLLTRGTAVTPEPRPWLRPPASPGCRHWSGENEVGRTGEKSPEDDIEGTA